ncbi:PepSY domain-containing protein [Sphingosinicellaceae bacterium]|nr:PepSY domain-containing protein [Sphingosinicellaceae bacterium]
MTGRTVRGWALVHKWASVVSTAFLLMLCLTGLPLIFHDEIDAATGQEAVLPKIAGPSLGLDALVARGLATRPREVALYLSFDTHRPVVNLTTAIRTDAPADAMHFMSLDRRTGQVLPATGGGVTAFLLELHTDMFTGLPGKLFLGAMGMLFVAAIVSGVVLYAPFMRKLDFGTVRAERGPRTRWLDLHNLLGVVTVAWAMVVGLTGAINSFAEPLTDVWKADQLAAMTAPYTHAPPVTRLGSVDAAVATALQAAPHMRPQFVAFPGVSFSSRHHYAVFMQGATPLTAKLLVPALIDARTGALTAMQPMPWYMQGLLLSQPLHFGDYGGLPMKILWALLDGVTVVVLGSGLYLWLGRRRPAVARQGPRPMLRAEPAE